MRATTLNTRRRAGRVAALFVVGALLAAACGPEDDEPVSTDEPVSGTDAPLATEPPPATDAPPATEAVPDTAAPPVTDPPMPDMVTLTSPDGGLTIEVDGADAERFDPSISILDPSEWPPEIAGAENLPGVTVYQLEPDGAQFDVPVTVTRRVDVGIFNEVDAFGVPIGVLFTQDESGWFQPLDDPTVTRVGDVVSNAGTTTRFDLIGTLSLGSVVRFGGFVPAPNPPAFDDAAFNSVPIVDAAGITALTDAPLVEVAPRFESRVPAPTASPVDVRLLPEAGAGEGLALYNLGTTVENVPTPTGFFGDPEVDVPDTLSVTVIEYIAAVEAGDSDSASRLAAIADALAQGAGLQWSVRHSELGGRYPSFARAEYSGIPQLADGDNLYAVRYVGPSDGTGEVIDIARLAWDGQGYAADVGLVSYGPVQDAVLAVAGELPPELVGGNPDGFWVFAGSQAEVPIQLFTVTDTTTGDVVVFDVGPTEGPVFSGDVDFVPFPLP